MTLFADTAFINSVGIPWWHRKRHSQISTDILIPKNSQWAYSSISGRSKSDSTENSEENREIFSSNN